jgi:hypothetical protein
MSHWYLFFWFACLVYATHFWYKKEKLRYAILLGLSCGFITLTRPNEIICLLIPALYGVGSWADLQARFRHVRAHIFKYSAAAGFFLLPILPQVLYWLWITGSPIFYSYGDESFNFLKPRVYDGVFHFKNGWLVYTPVMGLAVLGLILLWRDKNWRLPVYAFLPLHLYIIYSWWCWNYINGFGSRPMVETYALLAIPLGHTLQFLMKRSATTVVMAMLLLFFAGLNLFQTWQFSQGILWSQSASSGYYISTFGKTELTYEDLVAYDTREAQPDSNRLDLVRLLYFNDFEDSTQQNLTDTLVKNGRFALALDGEAVLSPLFETSLKDAGIQAGDWIKFSAWCRSEIKEPRLHLMNKMVVQFYREGKDLKKRGLLIENKVAADQLSIWGGNIKKWGWLSFFSKVPRNVKQTDTLRVFVIREPSQVPVFVDDMRVELFRKK